MAGMRWGCASRRTGRLLIGTRLGWFPGRMALALHALGNGERRTRQSIAVPRLVLTWALPLLAALGAATAARADTDVLRIGIITDMSGQYSEGNGEGSVAAAQIAVEDFGPTVLGKRIEIISADHQNKPDIASTIVRNWIDTKGVDVVAEGVNSAVALAVQAVTRERNKIFLISGAGSSDLTGKSCSPTSVQWTYDTYASSNSTAKALVARGAKSWYFLTADYAFGHALERDAARAVEAAGGTIVGKVRHPFGNPDFSSFLLQAQSSPAQVIALANAGSDFANAIKQAHEFGLSQSDKIMAALQVTLTDSASVSVSDPWSLFVWSLLLPVAGSSSVSSGARSRARR